MTLLQIIVLAIVQGLTEFLPISSSGHLVLAPSVAGWADQGLAFDVAVHFGTLIGVVGFFRHDLLAIAEGMWRQVRGSDGGTEASLGWMIVAATIPVALVGLLFHDWIEMNLRSPTVIAVTTAAFGVLLWVSDILGHRRSELSSLSFRGALGIGCAQVLALIPGTSRSGITMTAALGLGLTRKAAARFSFLLSVPVIVLAAGYETVKLATSDAAVVWIPLITAGLVSALVAYLTIGFFLKFVDKLGMAPFAIYRILLASVIWYAIS